MIPRRMVFALLLSICIVTASPGFGAEKGFHPYLNLKGEYNDNLNLTSTNKRDDYISTVQPGIRFSNMDKQSGVDLDYSLSAIYYSDNSNLDYIGHNASLFAKYLTQAHLNFYLKESFVRSDNPLEREYFTTVEENKYVVATRTERATYWRNVVEPKIEYQFGPENRLAVSYRNNLYRTESRLSQDSREDTINPSLEFWFDRRNGISLQYGLTYGDFEAEPDLTGHMGSGRYIHRFSPLTAVFVEYTYSKRSFDTVAPTESAFKSDYEIHEPGAGILLTLGPTLTLAAQAGYFWARPDRGEGSDGASYKAELANRGARTTAILSLQGGYREDYFTSENLGFMKYHRLTGSLGYKLTRDFSLGCLGSLERAEYDADDRKDTLWGVGGSASYAPLKWLTFALEATHRERQSNIDLNDYKENRAMLTITASY